MRRYDELKELYNKIRCILGIHKWKPVNYNVPDHYEKSGYRIPHSKSKYYYFSRWRYCLNCGRIESILKWKYKLVTSNYINEPNRENLRYTPKKGILHYKGV